MQLGLSFAGSFTSALTGHLFIRCAENGRQRLAFSNSEAGLLNHCV